MPDRALRRNGLQGLFELPCVRLNASNARQGIKTIFPRISHLLGLICLNASNARQGIKTDGAATVVFFRRIKSERLQCPTGH